MYISFIFLLFRFEQYLSYGAEILVLNVCVPLQVHFTGQYGQHLPKRSPAGRGWERDYAVQASLPPGE